MVDENDILTGVSMNHHHKEENGGLNHNTNHNHKRHEYEAEFSHIQDKMMVRINLIVERINFHF